MDNVSLIGGHIDGADTCVVCGKEIPEGRQVCIICGYKVGKRYTNYDRIGNMSVKELAKFIHKIASKTEDCKDCPINDFCEERITRLGCTYAMFMEWLESEVEGE